MLDRIDDLIVGDQPTGDVRSGVGVAGELEAAVGGCAQCSSPEITAGFAPALHGGQGDHKPRPFVTVGRPVSPSETASSPAGQHHFLLGPFSGQGLDHGRFEARQLRGPFGRLGLAVALAQDVIHPGVETEAFPLDEILVVRTFGEPHMGDSLGQGGVGARPGGQPFIGVLDSGRVAEGVYIDHLDAELAHPDPPDGGLLRAVAAADGVGIVGPVHDHVGVLEAVFEQVVGLGAAEAPEVAVHMGPTPVEPFPAVGIIEDAGVAQHREEPPEGAGLVVHQAPVMVRRGDGRESLLPVRALHAGDLACNKIQRLVPADTSIARLAPVLRVALPARVEVFADHRVPDPVARVDALPLGKDGRGDRRPMRRGKLLAPGFDGPRLGVALAQDQRPHPRDLAVLNVHPNGAPNGAVHEHLLRHISSAPLSVADESSHRVLPISERYHDIIR